MLRASRILAVLCLAAAALGGAPALAEAPSVPKPAAPDAKTALRAQAEGELAQRRARLKLVEDELHKQSTRYDEMAARKMELAKISTTKQQAVREAVAQKAAKTQLAAAQAGEAKKPPAPKGGAAKAKDEKAPDAKAGGKDAGGAPKQIDPMLTQNYLVLRLRDEARQLRERIAYLEVVLARL